MTQANHPRVRNMPAVLAARIKKPGRETQELPPHATSKGLHGRPRPPYWAVGSRQRRRATRVAGSMHRGDVSTWQEASEAAGEAVGEGVLWTVAGMHRVTA